MAERTGKLTDWREPKGQGPYMFKVGGKWCKAWGTLGSRDRPERNAAVDFLKSRVGQSVAVAGDEIDNSFDNDKGERVDFYPLYVTEAHEASNGNGAQANGERHFVRGDPGKADEWQASRWAISAAIDAKAEGVEITDEILANAAILFRESRTLVAEEQKAKAQAVQAQVGQGSAESTPNPAADPGSWG